MDSVLLIEVKTLAGAPCEALVKQGWKLTIEQAGTGEDYRIEITAVPRNSRATPENAQAILNQYPTLDYEWTGRQSD